MKFCVTCEENKPDQMFRKHSRQCGECRYKQLAKHRGTKDYSGALSPGDRFDKITVKEVVKFHNGLRSICMAKCLCDCGTEKLIKISSLTSGRTKSCGCAAKQFKIGKESKLWQGCGDIPAEYWNRIVSQAVKRNIQVEITIQDAWSILDKQKGICAITGLPIKFGRRWETTASIDRIDSSKGYINSNVQWVHKDVNRMKNDFPLERFLEICTLVANKVND